MRIIPSSLHSELDRLESLGKWVRLYEIAIGDGSVYRHTDYVEDVSYGGETFTPYPIASNDIRDSATQTLESFTITVANIDRKFASDLENDLIVGEKVIIRHVFLDEDNVATLAFEETHEVLDYELDDDEAAIVFRCGVFNIAKLTLPKNKWSDTICDYPYKGRRCYYGSDEFRALSRYNLRAGGDGLKIQGWAVLNSAQSSVLDIDKTISGHLAIRINTGTNAAWTTTSRNAPFVHKRFPNNQDIDYEIGVGDDLTLPANENFEQVGLLLTEDLDDPNDWILIVRVFDTSLKIKVFEVVAGVPTTHYNQASTDKVLRLKRVGSDYSFYTKADEAAVYGSAIATFTNTSVTGGHFRLGIMAGTEAASRASSFQAIIDFARLLAGGLATCDRTLFGLNGCDIHGNNRRHGAAPGILHSSISL